MQILHKDMTREGSRIDVHCVFPPAPRDCVLHGIALWETSTSIQPLAVAQFDPVQTVLRGDVIDCTVNIQL